jgi:hypothetical protein
MKIGRPTKYSEDMHERAAFLIREFGMTDKQLAKAFGVAEASLKEWRQVYPAFSAATKEAKADYDSGTVEKSLLKRALGYRYKEVTKEKTDNGGMEITKEVIREMPPDTTAMIFWLKNRQPARWRDSKNIDHSGGVKIIHVSNVEEAINET